MKIRKISDTVKLPGDVKPLIPNVPIDKLRYQYESVPLKEMVAICISSVRQALPKRVNQEQARYEQVIAMAWEYENKREHPSKNIDVVIERFIVSLIKSGEDHGELIRDLHKARSKII